MHALCERASLAAMVIVATVGGAPKSLDQSVVGEIERSVLLVGRGLGANDRTLAVAGDLDA